MRKRYQRQFEAWMDQYWPLWRNPKNQHSIRYWDLRAAFDGGTRATDPERENTANAEWNAAIEQAAKEIVIPHNFKLELHLINALKKLLKEDDHGK